MSKIGIFLGFEYRSKIRSEGIGRLLGFMLKADLKQDIVVAMPEWLKGEFIALLEDQDIPQQKIEIITTRKLPYSIKLLESYKKFKEKKKRKGQSKVDKIIAWVSGKVRDKVNALVTSKNLLTIILMGVYLTLIVLLLLPFAILGYIALKGKRLLKRVIALLFKNGKRAVKKVIRKVYSSDDVGKVVRMLYERLHHTELEALVVDINKREEISMWYIPALFWPEVQGIRAKKVIAAPDIVYYDFPVQFATPSDQVMHDKLVKTIKCADHIICYSNYVKYNHIVQRFGIEESRVTVIEHGCIEMDKLLKVKKSIEGSVTQKQLAIETVEQYIMASGQSKEILRNVNWEKLRYITYSSQSRPHKNILSLIKAIAILNKEHYKNIKLVITGNIAQDKDIVKFISEHSMENEIIQFYNIPSKVLAAFNKLAICAVNPTMFEGGFPFTFSEAYSMQTPSVMSDIPVVTEKIEDVELQQLMLFDPYDVDSLVEKLGWALENADELYNRQSLLYKELKERNWELVVEEYISLFKKV